MFNNKKCSRCEGKLKEAYSFCPFCGVDLRNPEADARDFGMLGKNDEVFGAPLTGGLGGMGISDKVISSLFNTVMKSFEKQMQNMNVNEDELDNMRPEIERVPNGIKIKIGQMKPTAPKAEKKQKKIITDEQIKRMSKLPREEAKADVRRLSDKVVYELKAPGVEDVNDVFISKLENGYEIKAIGKSKVYVNSLPLELPIKGFIITEDKLSVEFNTKQQ